MKPRILHSRRAGRNYRLTVCERGLRRRILLERDGDQLIDKVSSLERLTLEAETGERLELRLTKWGRVRHATLHVGGVGLDMDFEPGTRAARRQQWEREHPELAALRHVAEGIGAVAVMVLGIGALFGGLFNRIAEPIVALIVAALRAIPFPEIALPSLSLPGLSLPRLTMPAWMEAVWSAKPYWAPILAGIAIAIWEVRRQRRQRELRQSLDAGAEHAHGPAGQRDRPDGQGRSRRRPCLEDERDHEDDRRGHPEKRPEPAD